jgi:hypothetical protein
MINLLPSNIKQSLAFAHHNTKLVKVIIGLAIGIVGLMVVMAGSWLYLQQETNLYKDTVSKTEKSLEQQHEKETLARVQDISNSLKLSVNVLSQEILFSKLLKQVGGAMPPNTVLQDLKLSSALDGAVDLQAGAKDYNSATQIQVNLEQHPDSVFDKADLVKVTCAPSDTTNGDNTYPCKAQLTAVFSKDNDFTLLKTKKLGSN